MTAARIIAALALFGGVRLGFEALMAAEDALHAVRRPAAAAAWWALAVAFNLMPGSR